VATDHPKKKAILDWFEQISRVPRQSKHEEKIRAFMLGWAKEHGFPGREDAAGTVLIEVPGTAGYEKSPGVILQGHLDMVCEKTKDSKHDFQKDPIRFVIDGEWLKADGTTLGADNGIAMAMAMEAAVAKDLPHPPLELLFTVDEETGLTGATALQPGFIKGKFLLNIDSEDEGVFTVGCAGGKDTHLRLPVATEAPAKGHAAFKLVAGGMSGGHSGVDIKQQRANAIHVLARALLQLRKQHDLRLADVSGGTAHNAIPRDAEAVITLPAAQADAARTALAALETAVRGEYVRTDPKLSLKLEAAGLPAAALPAADTDRAVAFLLAVPHGVSAMSNDIAGLVETSNNLATVKIADGRLVAHTSQRSSVMNRLQLLTDRIEGLARIAGGEAESGGGYPSWEPNMDSPLLARCKAVYKDLFKKDPVVEIIHAGLECGIIGSKYPGMDMISFGPTIKNPHSPDEKLEIATIGKVWDFLAALLKELR
jgi:dipeptidase D